MSRAYIRVALFVFAGELLGGCTQATVTPRTASLPRGQEVAGLMTAANQDFRSGRASDALSMAQKATRLNPSDGNISFVVRLLAERIAADPHDISVTPDDGFPEPDVGPNVAALLAGGRALYDGHHFRQAQDMFREAVILDPKNETADLMLQLVSTKIIDRDYEAIQHRTGTEVMRQDAETAEHLIPYSDLSVYPDNWPEITRRRDADSK